MQKDYYQTLGVDATASHDEIKTAYRQLARKYHPDSRDAETDETEAENRIREVNEAYGVIGNVELRSSYDRRRNYEGNDEEEGVGVGGIGINFNVRTSKAEAEAIKFAQEAFRNGLDRDEQEDSFGSK
jgi:DnaJ-class molecular chaperone